MFEPLQKLFSEKADTLNDRLERMLIHLAAIVENTQAEVLENQFLMRSGQANTGEGSTAIIELKPADGYMWKVKQVAITAGVTELTEEEEEEGKLPGETRCAVYIGSISPDNLIDFYNPAGLATNHAHYFVPENTGLIFHFYEQPENQQVTANIQVEQVHRLPTREADTGRSHEFIELPDRTSPVPSGHPLDERMIGAINRGQVDPAQPNGY